jgi:hypothetical protein
MNSNADTSNGFVEGAHLPSDVKQTCTADVTKWFAGNEIFANGTVTHANGLDSIFANFKKNSRCDFYRWGAQTFLWLTTGSDNYHVFNTAPDFYNVSVEENKQRRFIASSGTLALGVRKPKTDEEIELGQAGSNDALISQNGSLVYYGIHANDVYAMYTTGKGFAKLSAKDLAKLDDKQIAKLKKSAGKLSEAFPSTKGEIKAVEQFAKLYGYPIANPETMAIELKTSWVDATTVENMNDYVLTQAVVPIFDRSNPKGPWPATSTENKTLAMVGMHIVATLNGHPEMIWSTIEHVDNVPDNSYSYNNTKNISVQHSYDSSGNWNFLPTNAKAPGNIQSNAVIKALPDSTSAIDIINSMANQEPPVARSEWPNIEPVDVYRVNPWGNLPGNEQVDNNTDLASINVSVLSQLAPGDVRGNYIQTGGIWSAKGQIPPGYPVIFPSTENETQRNQNPHSTYLRGSLFLANTTMETFFQYKSDVNGDLFHANCFACHGQGESDPVPTDISHIFNVLQPLPVK